MWHSTTIKLKWGDHSASFMNKAITNSNISTIFSLFHIILPVETNFFWQRTFFFFYKCQQIFLYIISCHKISTTGQIVICVYISTQKFLPSHIAYWLKMTLISYKKWSWILKKWGFNFLFSVLELNYIFIL